MPRGEKAGKSTNWDDKAHADLLMFLLPVLRPTRQQWDEVIVKAEAKGYNYNASSVMYITSCYFDIGFPFVLLFSRLHCFWPILSSPC